MDNDKYVVFKRETWDGFTDDEYFRDMWATHSLKDAVVIRPQDIFAGPGLSAYASAIQTYIDMLLLNEAPPDTLDQWTIDQVNRMSELRDFFHEQAQLAFHHPKKKVPD